MDENEERKLEPEGDIPAEYEASYLNLRTVMLAIVVLVVVVALVYLLASALYGIFALSVDDPQPSSPFFEEGLAPEEIDRRVEARREVTDLYAAQTDQIEEYRWINREAGIAGIPVDRAMELLVERGRADFEGVADPPDLPDPDDPEAQAQFGQQVFNEFGCGGCHIDQDTPVAPTLVGIYGEERLLETGETIIADEEYLRQAILQPSLTTVAGFQPIMPSFQGRLSEAQLEALIAYIISIEE